MAWIQPKTDWTAENAPIKDDFNRMEGNTADLDTRQKAHEQLTDDAHGVGTKLPKAGGTMTGLLNLNGIGGLKSNVWVNISAGINGVVLIGVNCYIEYSTAKYKYANTHASLGARGIVFNWGSSAENAQPFFFDMGSIATTAGQEFTPARKKMWHENNDGAGSGLDADKFDGVESSEYNRKPSSATPGDIGIFDSNRNIISSGENINSIAKFSAGDIHLASLVQKGTFGSSDYYMNKVAEGRLGKGGTLRIKFTLKITTAYQTTWARIYKNGSPIGTLRTLRSTSNDHPAVTYTEDIAGWNIGDLVQIYGGGEGELPYIELLVNRTDIVVDTMATA